MKDYENGAKTIKLNVNSGDYKISKVKLEDGEVEKEIEGKKGAYAEGKNKFTYVSEDQIASYISDIKDNTSQVQERVDSAAAIARSNTYLWSILKDDSGTAKPCPQPRDTLNVER